MDKLWCFGDSFTAGHGCKYESSGTFSTQNMDNYYFRTYKDYIDETKKIWPEIVSEYFNLELINVSKNGMSNESIVDASLNNLINIKVGDIVILQTSTVGRYDFPFLKQKSLMGYTSKKHKTNDDIFGDVDSPYFYKTIFLSNVEKEYSEDLKNVLQYTNAQENLKNQNLILDKTKYDTIRNFFIEFISTEKYYERSVWRVVQISEILNFMGIKSYILNEDCWPEFLDKPSNLIEMHSNGMTGYVNENKKTIFYDTKGLIDDSHPSYDGHIDISKFVTNHIENENINIHNA
jgi:hypothetical protein